MSLNNIVRNFNNNVSRAQIIKGQNVLKKKLVLSVEEEIEEFLGLKRIMCEVKSENEEEVYLSSFDIDIVNDKVVKTECECMDHYNHCFYKDDYFCKHLIASFFTYIDELKEKEKIANRKNNLGEEILKDIERINKIREHIKLDVNLAMEESYVGDYFKASFKIGKEKFYSIKDLIEFINIKENGGVISYGKNITYSNETYRFTKDDEKIIDYIKDRVNTLELLSESKSKECLISKKYLNISEKALRKFLELCVGKEIGFNGRNVKVINEELKLSVVLSKNEGEEFELKGDGEVPLFISKNKDVYLYEDKIILPPLQQIREIGSFYEELVSGEVIVFKKHLGNKIFNELIPNLEKAIKAEVYIDKSIGEIEKKELRVKFYCDSYKKDAFIDVKLIYGEEEISFFKEQGDKIIIRDGKKEEEILEKLESLGLLVEEDKFIFPKSEEALYNFLIDGFKELKELGEVYYSEKFKERKIYNSPRITSAISKDSGGALSFSFEIEGVTKEEHERILKAFRENRRFYKLKDNSFISLENKETKEFLKVLDAVTLEKDNLESIKIEKNRAFLIGDIIEKSNLKCIKGIEYLQEIRDKFLEFKNKTFIVPKDINANLREYQIVGFNWFKTLSFLEFGGILADEMGLGKTLQTIAFIQSEKNKKSLIVTPTSLLYNWEKEFLKFSSGLKIGIVHGSKAERIGILKNAEDYDVLITTYGTLRNDEEEYNKLFFDYCIIDEAQNIKNPLSQNSRGVKSINARVRFALTGTPIENNLLELWSIFDFIMPSYLYGSNIFKKRFIEDENGSKKLQRYIAPFILRRLKKDVILELPDKIEKKYYVELTNEQKKIYYSYVKKVREELNGDGFDGNKITIFSYLTKLRQLCLEPKLLVKDYKGGNAKLKVAIDIIKESVKENHKVLVFSQFTSVLSSIYNELKKEEIEYYYLDGSIKAIKRIEMVDSFNEDKDKKVFLISLKAGGTGLNLTSADVVIHFDPWWNPAIENQATDRAHRIGQKNVVEVFKLIAEGTIEERILSLQESKRSLINSVMSEDFNWDKILKNLSVEELIDLFE